MTLASSKVRESGAANVGTSSSSAPPPPPSNGDKPINDVVAGAVARAASQGTIHPLDTLKVQMQVGRRAQQAGSSGARHAARSPGGAQVLQLSSVPAAGGAVTATVQYRLAELRGLYRGVVGAASGAGIIIGTYFAFYSTTKNFLRRHSDLSEGGITFVAGAGAAVGSGIVKVPLAVCIRSVQAGAYPNAFAAARSIVDTAGIRSLFTGLMPTLLEDVPDMAVKFTVYESLRSLHQRIFKGRQPTVIEDLLVGGTAGAAAAAATTPLDVVKTVMMCSASSRPTIASASKIIMQQGAGVKPFFAGVGPRALSNGLNSAIFFCFFEALRGVMQKRQLQAQHAALATLSIGALAASSTQIRQRRPERQWSPCQKRHCFASWTRESVPATCMSLAIPC